MDPITVATLLGTCTAVAGRVATAVLALNGLISKFSKADRNISRLGAQLNLFHATVEQLRQWLQKATVLSDTLKHTIQQSLHACDDVIADIDEHVWKIQPKPGEEGVRFYNRIRHIWDEATILEQERRLTTQFQALDLFIRVLQLYVSSLIVVPVYPSSNLTILPGMPPVTKTRCSKVLQARMYWNVALKMRELFESRDILVPDTSHPRLTAERILMPNSALMKSS